MVNFPPDSHPSYAHWTKRFKQRLSALPSCSLINWRNRLESVASHATRHSEDQMGRRKCWRKIRGNLMLADLLTDQTRMNKVNLQLWPWILTQKRSRNLVLLEELWCIRIRFIQVQMHKDRHQASVSEALGDLSSACSSQIWPWGAVNKQKQADSSKRRIWECRGPSIQTTFHTALRKDTLHVFRVFKERINFLYAVEAIWVAQLQTHHDQISHQKLSCKSTALVAPGKQLQGMALL